MYFYRSRNFHRRKNFKIKEIFRKDEVFLLTYGDGVTNHNINKSLSFHLKHKKIATLTSVKPPARLEIKLNGKQVRSFKEKPQLKNNWIKEVFLYLIQKFLTLFQVTKLC